MQTQKTFIELLLVGTGFIINPTVGIAFFVGILTGASITYFFKGIHFKENVKDIDLRFWIGVILAIAFAVIHTWVKELPFLLLVLPPALIGIDPKYLNIWRK